MWPLDHRLEVRILSGRVRHKPRSDGARTSKRSAVFLGIMCSIRALQSNLSRNNPIGLRNPISKAHSPRERQRGEPRPTRPCPPEHLAPYPRGPTRVPAARTLPTRAPPRAPTLRSLTLPRLSRPATPTRRRPQWDVVVHRPSSDTTAMPDPAA